MRIPPNPLHRLAPAALVVSCAALSAGCGPSQLAQEYDAYLAQVEDLLEEEGKHWDRIVTMIKKRADDAALPRYYQYVREQALPYYEKFHGVVLSVDPGGERMEAAHEHLMASRLHRHAAARADQLRKGQL